MGKRITIWIDPGKMTGIASWDSQSSVFTSLEVTDLKSLGQWIELLVSVNDYELRRTDFLDDRLDIELGWERYIITPGNTRQGLGYWSIEAIGVARYLALKHDFTILTPQISSMMSFSTDARLKLIGWYKPGKPHANDAARHLMRYMLRTGTLPIEMWNRVFSDEVLDSE